MAEQADDGEDAFLGSRVVVSLLMSLATSLDRAIYTCFPRWGARRMAIRRRFTIAQRLADRFDEREPAQHASPHWEGAGRGRLRGETWLASQLSPNSALEWELKDLRDRSDDLYKSNSYATGAIESQVTDIIGGTVLPKSRIPVYPGATTQDEVRQWKKQLELLFARWSPYAGLEGDCFLALMRLAVRCWKRDGDVLVVLSDVGSADKPIALAVEVIEAERIETPPEELGNPNCRLGIERDPRTKEVVAYWVRMVHPGDTREWSLRYRRIERRDATGRCRAMLLFEKLYPGQVRGLPAMFSVLNRLKDVHDIEESRRIGEAIAACFSAFIRTVGNPEDAAEGAATKIRHGKRIEDLEPGTIDYLNENEEVTFGQPNYQGGDLADWLESQLRAVAAGMNQPYTSVARKWQDFTMSGGRLELILGRKIAGADRALLSEIVLYHVWRRFVLEAVVTGELDVEPYFFNSWEWLFCQHGWIFSGQEWLEPASDIQADALAVECKFKTRHQVIGERGGDYDEVLDELEEEEEDLSERGMSASMPLMNRSETPPENTPATDKPQATKKTKRRARATAGAA